MKDYILLGFLLLYFTSSLVVCVPFQRSTYTKFSLPDGRIRRVKRNYYPTTYTLLPIFGEDPSPPQESSRLLEQNRLGSGEPAVLPLPDPTQVPSQPRTPRNYYLSQIFPYLTTENGNNLISFRRYRSALPTISPRANDAITQNSLEQQHEEEPQQQNGKLRILGWLFGRPNYSPYPNYSMLESAAGVGLNRYPYGSRPMGMGMGGMGMGHHGPSYVVEECTELLDPITHEIIEDCYEVY